MVNITLEDIQNKIQEAMKYDPCENTLDTLLSLSSIEEYVNHPDAPYWVYWICLKQGKRWEEAESIILTSSFHSYLYVLYVIKGRWKEAEETHKVREH